MTTSKKKGGRPRKPKTLAGAFVEALREHGIGKPPWPDEGTCLLARHQAAYEEARGNPLWPGAVRAQLQSPNHADLETNDERQLREKIAELSHELADSGPILMRAMTSFRDATIALRESELRQIEDGRRKVEARGLRAPNIVHSRTLAVVDAIDAASALIDLQSKQARIRVEGKSDGEAKGRRRDPGRGQAAMYAIPTGVFDWTPTARDLALISIAIYRTRVLPSEWRVKTVAQLISAEANAMRVYLPPTDRK